MSRGLADLIATLQDPSLVSRDRRDRIQVMMALRGLRAGTSSIQNALLFVREGVRKLDQGLDAADQRDRAAASLGGHQNLTYGAGGTSPGITKVGEKKGEG